MNDSSLIQVSSPKHSYTYSVNGQLPNPLEATYAALAACAGVYTLKAAKKIGKSAEGIKIQSRPVMSPASYVVPNKWITEVEFPKNWNELEQNLVLNAIKDCAVKELLLKGNQIEFNLVSSSPDEEFSLESPSSQL